MDGTQNYCTTVARNALLYDCVFAFYESSALKKCVSVSMRQGVSESGQQKEKVTPVLLSVNAVSMLHLKSQHSLCAQVRCGTLCIRAIEICLKALVLSHDFCPLSFLRYHQTYLL